MELTSRVYRRLKLICGNIARTVTPASFRRCVSGLVERWVMHKPLPPNYRAACKIVLKREPPLSSIADKIRNPDGVEGG